MTSQTKNYIELSDILAIRCQCEHCGTTIALPITREIRAERLQNCPNCNEQWTEQGYGVRARNVGDELGQFVASFQKLSQSLAYFRNFRFFLEISNRQEPSGSVLSKESQQET